MATSAANKHKHAKNVRLIDNPLYESTAKRQHPAITHPVQQNVHAEPELPVKRLDVENPSMSTEEEKMSVLEIVSDLEKQLDVAFSIKDAQAEEIDKLKQELRNSRDKITNAQAQIKELEEALMEQEALNSKLEFLESERLKACEEIKGLEQKLRQEVATVKSEETSIEKVNEEKRNYLERIEHIEAELESTKSMLQGLQNQNLVLRNEKDALFRKLNDAEQERNIAVRDRDNCQKELDKAKESLEEIRLMLSQTKARARDQYIKPHNEESTKHHHAK